MPSCESLRKMKPESAIGIDLGTTYSRIACLDSTGQPKCLLNFAGDVLTPSSVFVDDDGVIVGKNAVTGAVSVPENYADCFKRDMGRPTYRHRLHGTQVPPEVLSAMVLEQLKRDAELCLGPVQKVVITVPAYFDELRRKATQDAGRLAGWEVLDIVNEPATAALCCGLERGLFGLGQPATNFRERIVVYDLGGGTFDVSLLEIDPTTFRTIATDGDVQLGGKDFDERLVNHVAMKFLETHGLDPRTDPQDAFRLWLDAQDAKQQLTEHGSVSILCRHAGLQVRIGVTRSVFEELTSDLLERTRETTDLLVRRAGFSWEQIDRVVLSGGSVRMPMVARMLRSLTGKEPDRSLSPDEAVAHGAAIYAGIMLGSPAIAGRRECQLINVNSHSLGVVGINEKIQQHVNAVLIPRNTPIPAQAVKGFKTLFDGQRSVAVPVVEGESERPEFCAPLGQCVIRDLPADLPKGTLVEVTYRYLANGRLAVSAWLPDSGHSAGVEIRRDHPAVSGNLDSWKEAIMGRQSSPAVAVAEPSSLGPAQPVVNVKDRAVIIQQIDACYVRVGHLAANCEAPPAIAKSWHAVRATAEAREAAEQAVGEAESHREGAVGTAEAIQLGVELSRAHLAHRRAASRLEFAYLVLGRDCASEGFCPPGAESDIEEIRHLRQSVG
jgi:molecular chaperone DnaK